MYAEASSPRVQGDSALLTSGVFDYSDYCLEFWYHMYGGSIGTLNVWTLPLYDTTPRQTIWSADQDLGDAWRVGRVSISLNDNVAFRLAFQAVIGSSFSGDMAIDDVVVTNGVCPGTFKIFSLS